jgi:hypothetical protein
MADWVGRVGVALQPLVERLREKLGERQVIHADETPVRQLDPGSGKTRRAYLWAYCSAEWDEGPPILVFDYQESRQGIHARNFLGKWSGYLMVDDYAGYKALFGPAVSIPRQSRGILTDFSRIFILFGNHDALPGQLDKISVQYPNESAALIAFDVWIGNRDRGRNLKASVVTPHLPVFAPLIMVVMRS